MNEQTEMVEYIESVFSGRRYLYPGGVEKKVDAVAWCALADQLGYGAEWIIEWVNAGFDTPPKWMDVDYVTRRRARVIDSRREHIDRTRVDNGKV